MSLQNFNPAYLTIEEKLPFVVATVTRPRLCEEDNIEHFGVELNQLLDHYSCRWLALDLQEVKMITSAAVGKLIALHRNLHRREGQLALCGVVGITHKVFQSANLLDYFHVTPSVADAIEQLSHAKAAMDSSS